MNKFKPGEMAILVNLTHYKHLIGTRCEIISYIGSNKFTGGSACDAYEVLDADGDRTEVATICLRKIPPKEEAGSWADCVWKPESVKCDG